MLISGTLVIMMMGGALSAFVLAGIALAVYDKHVDNLRRHWKPAESSTHW